MNGRRIMAGAGDATRRVMKSGATILAAEVWSWFARMTPTCTQWVPEKRSDRELNCSGEISVTEDSYETSCQKPARAPHWARSARNERANERERPFASPGAGDIIRARSSTVPLTFSPRTVSLCIVVPQCRC